MTIIIAETKDYLVQTGDTLLTISRYSDGYCKAVYKRGNVSEFKKDLREFGADKTISDWLKGYMSWVDWKPLYKPTLMPRNITV